MKLILKAMATGSLLAAFAIAQAPARRYTVADLGTLPGGKFSQATSVNNSGVVTGVAALPDGTQHAVQWREGHIIDLTTAWLRSAQQWGVWHE